MADRFISVLVSMELRISDEFNDLDAIDLNDPEVREDLEAAIQMHLADHWTHQVGTHSIDDHGYPWTDTFYALWQNGFDVEARVDDFRLEVLE